MRIKIAGIAFDAPVETRFAPGHVCTANEALALQRTLLENLANNTRNDVTALKEAAARAISGLPEKSEVSPADVKAITEDLVDQAALAALRDKFAAYASTYVFGAMRERTTTADMDPVEAEAFRLALEAVKKFYKAQGHKLTELDPEILDAAAFKVLEDPEQGDAFRASARTLIEAKQRLSGISALFTPDQP